MIGQLSLNDRLMSLSGDRLIQSQVQQNLDQLLALGIIQASNRLGQAVELRQAEVLCYRRPDPQASAEFSE